MGFNKHTLSFKDGCVFRICKWTCLTGTKTRNIVLVTTKGVIVNFLFETTKLLSSNTGPNKDIGHINYESTVNVMVV
jgi:hypothetical protein